MTAPTLDDLIRFLLDLSQHYTRQGLPNGAERLEQAADTLQHQRATIARLEAALSQIQRDRDEDRRALDEMREALRSLVTVAAASHGRLPTFNVRAKAYRQWWAMSDALAVARLALGDMPVVAPPRIAEPKDAPSWYSGGAANVWASGYNDAVRALAGEAILSPRAERAARDVFLDAAILLDELATLELPPVDWFVEDYCGRVEPAIATLRSSIERAESGDAATEQEPTS